MYINGIELQFDFYDSDQKKKRDAYMEALKAVNEISLNPIPEGVSPVDRECEVIKSVFDRVFGEGTGDEVCGYGHNHLVCLETLNDLVENVNDQHRRYKSIKQKIGSMGAGKR